MENLPEIIYDIGLNSENGVATISQWDLIVVDKVPYYVNREWKGTRYYVGNLSNDASVFASIDDAPWWSEKELWFHFYSIGQDKRPRGLSYSGVPEWVYLPKFEIEEQGTN